MPRSVGANQRRPRGVPFLALQVSRRRLRLLLLAAFAGLFAVASGAPARADELAGFDEFCNAHFGAEKEPEIYLMFGNELGLDTDDEWADGDWSIASVTSAVVAWETNLPSRGNVRYADASGPGTEAATPEDDRYQFLHVHYLHELQPGTTYTYRLTAVDERGNRVTSDARTLTTGTALPTTVRIPEDMPGGPPYLLDRASGTYLLTHDIVAPATAINVVANVSLDLGGHTVVYDDVAGAPDPVPPGQWGVGSAHPAGIRVEDGRTVHIYNGTIRQGRGGGGSDPSGGGYNPVVLRRPLGSRLAGLTIDYHGDQVTGIFLHNTYDGNEFHHNVLVDRGSKVDDRHAGVDAIGGVGGADGTPNVAHHNLVRRTRHRGITARSNSALYHNEIYVDSWATNSYGILYYSSNAAQPTHDIGIHGNRIFGTGYHPIGIGAGYYAHDIRVKDNYVQMQGQAPSGYRWPGGPGDPAGQEHPVNGIRWQKGPQRNIAYSGNAVVVKARGLPDERVMMRGLWVVPMDQMTDCVFRDNRVKAEAENEYADGYAIAALGTDSDTPASAVQYVGNVVMSNTANIRFNDNYGFGGKHHFADTTLVRLGDDGRYQTIKMGWAGSPRGSYGHTFLDTRFENGASFDRLAFEGDPGARYDFAVRWTLTVRTDPGAGVHIRDAAGNVAFDVEGGGTGTRVSVPLTQMLIGNRDRTIYTPHTVAVTNPECEVRQATVTMDQPRALDLACHPVNATPTLAPSPSPTSSTAVPTSASTTPTVPSTTMPTATPAPVYLPALRREGPGS